MTTYEPGTVAVATVRGVLNVRVFRTGRVGLPRWVTPDCEHRRDSEVTDVRPLVTLDLDTSIGEPGIKHAEEFRVIAGHVRGTTRVFLEHIADQIEAQTKPPKPPEPTGLGAVVEDAEGRRWVRVDRGLYPWESADDAGGMAYRHLDAVRVLSEGWSA